MKTRKSQKSLKVEQAPVVDEVNTLEPPFDADNDESQLTYNEHELAKQTEPFLGRWYRLVSTTNWEKGRIIQQWRDLIINSGATAAAYSDEAWSRMAGGVTSSHAGRLRRVFRKFGESYESYPGLFWSHFLAALDWDDAEMWLEGAVRSGWTVDRMRQTRWEAGGAVAEDQPRPQEVLATEPEEDVPQMSEPAQGGGRKRMDGDPDRIATGPRAEDPDFGDADTDRSLNEGKKTEKREPKVDLARPFAGLPDLPADLGDALEMFKLAIVRHKAGGWTDVGLNVVLQALDGLRVLAQQPA